MKTKVNAVVDLEDGKHEGVIKGVEYKDKPYEYVDVVITEKENEFEIKCGVPHFISKNTSLGVILINFGCDVESFIGKEIDIEDYIKTGMKVEFVTVMKEAKKGKFCNIEPQSLKPKK